MDFSYIYNDDDGEDDSDAILLWSSLLKENVGESQCVKQKNAVSQLDLEQRAWGPAVIAHILGRSAQGALRGALQEMTSE